MKKAVTFCDRIFGLMFVRKGEPFFISNCQMIHTCFLRFDLDLFWVDREGRVIREDKGVKPWRIRRCRAAWGVIESPAKINFQKSFSVPGQALVETALVMPFLLLFIFGFLQLSVAVTVKQKLSYVTHFAAQVGSLTNDDRRILGAINEFYDEDAVELSLVNRDSVSGQEIVSSQRRSGDRLTVSLRQAFPLNISLLGLSDLSLSSEASSSILCNETNPPYTCS